MRRPRLTWPKAYALAASDDGRLVACTGLRVVVIDMVEHVRASVCHPFPHPRHVSFSPSGERLAVKSTSGRIAVLDPRAGSAVADFANQREGEGCDVHFSPDGRELIDGSWGGILTIRRATDGGPIARWEHPGELLQGISHDASRRLWLVLHSHKVRQGGNTTVPGYLSVHRWPFVEDEARNIFFDMHVEAAALSPDGERFCFLQGGENRIFVARTSDGEILARSPRMDRGGIGLRLAWSVDGSIVAVTARTGEPMPALSELKDRLAWIDAARRDPDRRHAVMFYRSHDLSLAGTRALKYASSIAFMPNGEDVVLGSWETSLVEKLEPLVQPMV